MNTLFIGVDLAKNVFQLCGLNTLENRFIRNALAEKNYFRQWLIFRPA